MLMASTSLAGSASGRRTVNFTSARGSAEGVGPLEVGEEGALGVDEKGDFSSDRAHAWLLNARTVIIKRMRREKTERDFISLLSAFVSILFNTGISTMIPLTGTLPCRRPSRTIAIFANQTALLL